MFKYFGFVFMSDGKQNKEIDIWIAKENTFQHKLITLVTKSEL